VKTNEPFEENSHLSSHSSRGRPGPRQMTPVRDDRGLRSGRQERAVHQNGHLLSVHNLKKYFPVRRGVFSRIKGHIKAVDDVSFTLDKGKTLGLVGESGCGKTTLGRTILRLLEPTAGRVVFKDLDLFGIKGKRLRQARKFMQIIFQDPFGSLNPRMTVGGIVGEPLAVHKIGTPRERREKVAELLERVGLEAAHSRRYPHEFSGGQRQRIGIARAIALNPDFIVCDEPVSALDVSIRAQIINLLEDLQAEFQMAYLFIAHDLSVVEHISDEVAVMYFGKIVEMASREEIYRNPLHPYTKALLSAIPVPDPKARSERIPLPGDVPSALEPPPGCLFSPRCSIAEDSCRRSEPELEEIQPGHFVRCFKAAPKEK